MPKSSYLDNNFKAAEYHNIRPSYPQTLVNYVMQYHKGPCNQLLDVGCGTGIATSLFSKFFNHSLGIDPSDRMLEIANASNESDTVVFKKAFGETMVVDGDVMPDSVDMVIGAESIHWCQLDKAFDQVKKSLRNEGTFAFWFYSQPEFIDLDDIAEEIYYKYGWGDKFMGKYLTEKQREIFTQDGGSELNVLLSDNFKDVECIRSGKSVADKNGPYYVDGTITIKQLHEFVKTWSLYQSWVRDHPGEADISDIFIEEFKKKCGIEDDNFAMRVQWKTILFIGRK